MLLRILVEIFSRRTRTAEHDGASQVGNLLCCPTGLSSHMLLALSFVGQVCFVSSESLRHAVVILHI